MSKIQQNMKPSSYANYSRFSPLTYRDEITDEFLSDANLLNQIYGEFVGEAKAKHPEYLNELNAINKEVVKYFESLLRSDGAFSCYKMINLASMKISELLSFVDIIEKTPPEDKVSKASYDILLREKEEAEKTAKFLVQYSGLPELHTLIENSKNIKIPVDEHWVLALCSSNLIEAVVNKKLEALSVKVEGSFKQKYSKLCEAIKEKEGKDISQLLPLALYEGVRNKLDHASDAKRVTAKEAKDISELVIKFMKEIFP